MAGAASSSLLGIHRDLLALLYGFSAAMALLAIAAYASALVTAARTTPKACQSADVARPLRGFTLSPHPHRRADVRTLAPAPADDRFGRTVVMYSGRCVAG